MGGLGLDALGGRRGNRTLAHGLDCGGGRGGQGGVGGSCLRGHAHHLLLLLKVILRKKTNKIYILIQFFSGQMMLLLKFMFKKIQEAAMIGRISSRTHENLQLMICFTLD